MYREDPTSDPPLCQAAVDLVSSSNYFFTAEFDTVFTSGSSPRDHANVSSRPGMIETKPKKRAERALLIGLEQDGVSKWDLRDSMEELRELASSAGAEVVDTVTQKLPKPTAPFYIGKGKAEAIRDAVQSQRVTSVISNDELSPAEGRNLENLLSRKVLDRTQLILDIFAQRARSREGRLQIELAQLQYLLPRLTRMWHHLSRQTGGIGTRGPGETQLEVDRRRVQERISRLERELEGVRKVRSVQRQGRKRHQWPVAAVVGYTNAGKSTLLNLMTGADVLAVDKLFATLDATTRQCIVSYVDALHLALSAWRLRSHFGVPLSE